MKPRGRAFKPRSLRDKVAYAYCLLKSCQPPESCVIYMRPVWTGYRDEADDALAAIKKAGLVLKKSPLHDRVRAEIAKRFTTPKPEDEG